MRKKYRLAFNCFQSHCALQIMHWQTFSYLRMPYYLAYSTINFSGFFFPLKGSLDVAEDRTFRIRSQHRAHESYRSIEVVWNSLALYKSTSLLCCCISIMLCDTPAVLALLLPRGKPANVLIYMVHNRGFGRGRRDSFSPGALLGIEPTLLEMKSQWV